MKYEIKNLYKFYIFPGKFDKEIEKYLPCDDYMELEEKIDKYATTNSFRKAWYKIYKINENYIEKLIAGDWEMVDMIDFNNLLNLFLKGWPDCINKEKFLYRPKEEFRRFDYSNIAHRFWTINMIRI